MDPANREYLTSQTIRGSCPGKRYQRIRTCLSEEAESSATDILQVSVTGGSGHVCPGKLNRRPLPSGDRRRMWYIRRWWNAGPDRITTVRYPEMVESRPDKIPTRVE